MNKRGFRAGIVQPRSGEQCCVFFWLFKLHIHEVDVFLTQLNKLFIASIQKEEKMQNSGEDKPVLSQIGLLSCSCGQLILAGHQVHEMVPHWVTQCIK